MSDVAKGITIDDSTTKDRDDAIWLHLPDGGGFEVLVSIANVAKAVPREHQFDVGTDEHRGAYQRIETKYHANGNVPMLPRHLSEDRLSLVPTRKREVMQIRIRLDRYLDVPEPAEVTFGPFKSLGALVYSEVPAVRADEGHKWHKQIVMGAALANDLLVRRRAAGALVFYDLTRGWATNEDGVLVKLGRDEATVGYVIVQELMILANRELARYCALNDIPILYRNHTARASAPDREELQRQLDAAMGQDLSVLDTLHQRANLVFNRADYGPTLQGHYGLNLPAYMHSTSPIRRYADLVNQRQLLAHCTGKPLPYTPDDLAEVATHINTTLQERREATSAFLRHRDEQQMERHLSALGELYHLTPKEFDRAIKLAVRSGAMVNGLNVVFDHRLRREEVNLLAQSWVLFAGDDTWNPLKQTIIKHLQESARHDAPSLFGIAANVHGVTPPRWHTSAKGQSHLPVFTVAASTTRNGERVHGPAVQDRSKKGAQQLAAVALLAVLAGLEPPEAVATVEDTPAPAPAPVTPPSAGSANPIGTLQEHCQRLGVGVPVYEKVASSGPSHAPTFEYTCAALGGSARGRGASAKAAKRAAAEALICQLQEAPL